MASHRRPKQPSRTRVTVLTATAAAAVALTSQAAHADPKPTKDEVKSKVDKLYDEAEQATEKANGAKEKQDKLEKQVGADPGQGRPRPGGAQRRCATASVRWPAPSTAPAASTPRSQLFLSSNPDDYLDKASTLDQLSAKQAEALQKIQAQAAHPRAGAPGGPEQAEGPRRHPQGAGQEEEGSPGQARRRAEAAQHADRAGAGRARRRRRARQPLATSASTSATRRPPPAAPPPPSPPPRPRSASRTSTAPPAPRPTTAPG